MRHPFLEPTCKASRKMRSFSATVRRILLPVSPSIVQNSSLGMHSSSFKLVSKNRPVLSSNFSSFRTLVICAPSSLSSPAIRNGLVRWDRTVGSTVEKDSAFWNIRAAVTEANAVALMFKSTMMQSTSFGGCSCSCCMKLTKLIDNEVQEEL